MVLHFSQLPFTNGPNLPSSWVVGRMKLGEFARPQHSTWHRAGMLLTFAEWMNEQSEVPKGELHFLPLPSFFTWVNLWNHMSSVLPPASPGPFQSSTSARSLFPVLTHGCCVHSVRICFGVPLPVPASPYFSLSLP